MYKAGTASEKITPTEPLWMAGYAARTQPAQGTISDLFASALALEDSAGGWLIIASIDLIAITKAITDPVCEAVQRELGLPRERLVLPCTHTHFGPEFRDDKVTFFKVPPEYATKLPTFRQQLIDALVRVIVASTKNMVPVRLVARRSAAGFAHNRRREGVKGGAPSPQDTLDHDVPILDVIHEPTGLRKAIVFGYACHNTTIDPQDYRYCADWAGFAKEHLQKAHPGATALFITGCGADQNPEPRGTVELSKEYGTELAVAVERMMARDEGVEINGPIRAAYEDVPLPLEPVTREELTAQLASDDPPKRVKARFLLDQIDRGEPVITEYPAPTQAIRLGDELLMIIMSAETVVDWAIKFKFMFVTEAPMVWVAGYCNDMYGYVPTKRIQSEGGYEGGRATLWSWMPSSFTDELEDRLTNAVRCWKLVEPNVAWATRPSIRGGQSLFRPSDALSSQRSGETPKPQIDDVTTPRETSPRPACRRWSNSADRSQHVSCRQTSSRQACKLSRTLRACLPTCSARHSETSGRCDTCKSRPSAHTFAV